MMKIGDVLIGIVVVILLLGALFLIIWLFQKERLDLERCSEALGYNFTMKNGIYNNPIEAVYINETSIACCLRNSRFVTSEGVIVEHKCILEINLDKLK